MSHDFIRVCHAAFQSGKTVPLALFVAGLMGSVTHCAGMCGPFVLSQTAKRLDDLPLGELSLGARVSGGALIPYHAGRTTTYAFLGSIAASMTGQLREAIWFHSLSATLLILAGIIFLLNGFPVLRNLLSKIPVPGPRSAPKFLATLFTNPVGLRGYALGLALGFLPCGLVYGAILSVAASGEPLTAALGMIAFALGTVPVLVGVGIGGQYAFRRFRSSLRFVFPLLMAINSLALFALAGELIK